MDKIDSEQRTAIKKMATERLILYLSRIGIEEDELLSMDRSQLMEAWANAVYEGRDKPPTKVETEIKGDYDLQLKRLEFEMMRYQEEKEIRRLEREERQRKEEEEKELKRIEQEERRRKEDEEKEMRRLEREERQRKEEDEKEERRRKEDEEREIRRLEREERQRKEEEEKEERRRREEEDRNIKLRELQLREDELNRQRNRDREENERKKSLVSRTKLFMEAMKGVVWKFPGDPVEIPGYFEHLENLFELYDVDEAVKSKLLQSQLNDRAKSLVVRLSRDDLDNYDSFKGFLLNEFKISSLQLRDRFNTLRKANDETCALLASKLHNALMYYLKS